MVLSQAQGQRDYFFVVNGERYPALLGEDDTPAPIHTAPDTAFPEALVIGDSSRATDQRTASLVTGDFTGGAGEFRYPTAAGQQSVNTFAYSDGDTRYAHALVQRPNPLALTNTLASAGVGQQVIYTGLASARMLSFAWGQPIYRYDPTVPAWNTTAVVTACYGLVRGGDALYANRGDNLYRSTDGVTWTVLATTGLPAATSFYGLARHDNKLLILYVSAAGVATLYYSTNFNVPASATWTAGGSFFTQLGGPIETGFQLVEWRDRYGRRALFCLTTLRLVGYDDDSGTWQEFANLAALPGVALSGYVPQAYVWPRDDNLYITTGGDTLYRYTGQEIDILGPNLKGGLPAGQQFTPRTICGNSRYLFIAGNGGTVDTASVGGVWTMNAQDGWHRLYRDATNTNEIWGCGYGNNVLWTVEKSGTAAKIYQLKVPDLSDNPLNATSGQRDYDASTITSHILALFDGGAPNIPFQPLSVEIICKKMNARDLGLLAGTLVSVYYRTNLSGGWVALATLASTSAFPARIPINAGVGVLCNDLEIRLDLSTNSTSQTPVVTDVIVHYLRQPMVRQQYTCQVDLRDTNPIFKQDSIEVPAPYGTNTAAALRKKLYDLAGMSGTNNYRAQVVPFSYAGDVQSNGPNKLGLAATVIRVASVEDPLRGFGVFTLAIADVSTAASG